MQNVFKRVEQKYLLTESEYLLLQEVLDNYFLEDKYYKSNIYNLYFDNQNNDILINSIDKPKYKEKIRLRSYKEPNLDDIVYLEIKQKYKGVVYKRRVELTLKDYLDYEEKRIINDNQIMKEIDYYIKYYDLKPNIFVSYDRLSYYFKEDNNFRITFDTNLRYRFNNLSLKDTKDNKYYFDTKMYIMEVKCLNSLPLWFVKILSNNKIYPKSFSKVGNIYLKERGISYVK